MLVAQIRAAITTSQLLIFIRQQLLLRYRTRCEIAN